MIVLILLGAVSLALLVSLNRWNSAIEQRDSWRETSERWSNDFYKLHAEKQKLVAECERRSAEVAALQVENKTLAEKNDLLRNEYVVMRGRELNLIGDMKQWIENLEATPS